MSKLSSLVFALFTVTAALPLSAQPKDPVAQPDPAGDGDVDGDGDGDGDGDEPAVTDAATPPPVGDVDALRRRYLELRDKLFRSRARAATVATALYSTRAEIKLHYKSGRHYTVTRAIIRLDGANVYDDADGKIAEGSAVRFEGFVAPGRHRVTIRVEATGKDDDRFTTSTEATFVAVAVEGEDLLIDGRASDDGDIAYKWQRSEKGSYRLGIDVDVKSVERKDAKKKKKSAAKQTTKESARAAK